MSKYSKYHGQFGIPFSKIAEDREIPYIVPLGQRIIIGIVGLKYAGKSLLAGYLRGELGYRIYSLSRYVREEADRLCLKERGRATLQDLGDKLRQQYGRDVLARKAIQDIYSDVIEKRVVSPRIVVEGIKNYGEMDVIRRVGGYLIGVYASKEVRHRRAQLEGSFNGTIETFSQEVQEVDERDMQSVNVYGQEVYRCLEMVQEEYRIMNESTRDEFIEKCNNVLSQIMDRRRYL